MTTGVALMAYGTPSGPADIARYYTDIRRGRAPTAEQLYDLRCRYDAIGGTSPLRQRTEAQAAGLAERLGSNYLISLGMKHSGPTIEAAVGQLQREGVRQVVGVILAPHFSALSVGEYLSRARAAAGSTPFVPVHSWHLHPLLIETLAARVAEKLAEVSLDAIVVFTAHSLPSRIVESGDPYPSQVAATAHAVAGLLRLSRNRWRVAWQSAGRTSEPWLGPDILDLIAAASDGGAIVVCPVGFVSDHLETLYDLDVQAAALASSSGVQFARTRALDVDVCPVLTDVVLSTSSARVSTMGL